MPAERYFLNAPFHTEQTLFLQLEELHHMRTVMRTKEGQTVELVNGKNLLAHATLIAYRKEGAELLITSVSQAPQKKNLILAQALPRFNRLEWIIEKGTELNVTAFWLFPGERSEKTSLSPTQHKRLAHLSICALKQCGRLDLPQIELKGPLLQWPPFEGTSLYGDTRTEAPPIPAFKDSICFFVGPEKGFSENELFLLENTLGARGVKLHANTLRVDTAAIAAVSLLSQ